LARAVEEFAFPLPSAVIMELLGVSLGWREFNTWIRRASDPKPDEFHLVPEAWGRVKAIIQQIIWEKEKEPGEDLLSGLIQARAAGDGLSHDELLSTGVLLLMAGYTTTTSGPLRHRPNIRPRTGYVPLMMTDVRRPLTRLTVVSLAAHVAFELGAGVGLPLASVVGPYAATGFWTVVTGGVLAASTRDARADNLLAAANGFGLAAVSAHLLGWPTRPTRTGLPWLEDCEGLGPELMPYYNPILYCSGVTGLLAVACENRTARVRLSAAMLGLVPVLIAYQHWEHRRLVRQAHTRPRWWNRRLRRLTSEPAFR